MANLQAVGTPERPATLTDRLNEVKGRLHVTHTRFSSVAGRAGLLPPAQAGEDKKQAERSDLSGIVDDLERLCESLLNDCADIERIA